MTELCNYIDKLPPHIIVASLVIMLLITVIFYRGLNR